MVASTTVKITNSTGKTASFVSSHDFHGHNKGRYPEKIENGETIQFVFENTEVKENGESSGTVVYRGKNEKGEEFDWMYAWYNKDGAPPRDFKAYTEITDAGQNAVNVWKKLMDSGPISHATYKNCVSNAQMTGQQGQAVHDGKMYLKG